MRNESIEAVPFAEKEQGFEFYLSVIKRRWPYFLIPFVIVLSIGGLVAMLMPPIYRSEARILVQSQQIPLDLVKPTVTASAEERIQIIAQRIMTRDNLMGIVNKFGMFPKWRTRMSDTDLVDLMRERTSITPIALNLAGSAARNTPNVAFTVGFEYENPQLTMQVANELVTLILNEDVRARTSRAAETTKFLASEVERLQAERMATESQIADLKRRFMNLDDETAEQLSVLKAQLLQKRAVYSESHPEIMALKERIKALEQSGSAPTEEKQAPNSEPALGATTADAPQHPNAEKSEQDAETPGNTSISLLESKEKSLQDDLDKARAKLLAASQGERLEENQQSERFEVIEQPTYPQEPIKPNRKKLLAMGFALSLVAGFAGVFAIESYDKTIRGAADMPIPARLIVTIPYIATKAETESFRKRLKIGIAVSLLCFVLILALIHWLVIPLDLVFQKVMDRLLGV